MLYIDEIIIEPTSISQEFIIFGTFAEDDDFYDESELLDNSFIFYVDFSSLHTPQCHGAENPGTPSSDYELWTPHDGRHGQ